MTSQNTKAYTLDFIPSEESIQGFMRLILELENETILKVDPHIGFLHRGIEKILENRTYLQGLSYFDRLDVGAPLIQEQAFVLTVERLLGVRPPPRALHIRVLFSELTRLLSHLLNVGNMGASMGMKVPLSLAVEGREKILELFEGVSGSRFFPLYFRPGGVQKDVSSDFLKEMGNLVDFLRQRLQQIEDFLSENIIFKQRTVGMGVMGAQESLEWGLSGPILRAAGVAWDLRRAQPYDAYQDITFKIPTGTRGDAYDRYLVRMAEMYQSLDIIEQCLEKMPGGSIQSLTLKISPPSPKEMRVSMESLIEHIKLYREGFKVPAGQTYGAVESPRGEFGVFLVADGTRKPFRCKVRSPGFSTLQALDSFVKGHRLSDLPVILASLDISCGEVDR